MPQHFHRKQKRGPNKNTPSNSALDKIGNSLKKAKRDSKPRPAHAKTLESDPPKSKSSGEKGPSKLTLPKPADMSALELKTFIEVFSPGDLSVEDLIELANVNSKPILKDRASSLVRDRLVKGLYPDLELDYHAQAMDAIFAEIARKFGPRSNTTSALPQTTPRVPDPANAVGGTNFPAAEPSAARSGPTTHQPYSVAAPRLSQTPVPVRQAKLVADISKALGAPKRNTPSSGRPPSSGSKVAAAVELSAPVKITSGAAPDLFHTEQMIEALEASISAIPGAIKVAIKDAENPLAGLFLPVDDVWLDQSYRDNNQLEHVQAVVSAESFTATPDSPQRWNTFCLA